MALDPFQNHGLWSKLWELKDSVSSQQGFVAFHGAQFMAPEKRGSGHGESTAVDVCVEELTTGGLSGRAVLSQAQGGGADMGRHGGLTPSSHYPGMSRLPWQSMVTMYFALSPVLSN